jgi:hypothetical protein
MIRCRRAAVVSALAIAFSASAAPAAIIGMSSNQALSITEGNAVITWKTSRPANSQVQYGTTSSYGHSSGLDASLSDTP